MGYQPLPQKARKHEAQPKEEHPFFGTLPEDSESTDGASEIEKLPISSLTGLRYDPELISKEYR